MASALDPRLKDLKYLPRGAREEVWISLEVLLQEEPSRAVQSPQMSQQRRRGASCCWLQNQIQMMKQGLTGF